MSQPRLEPTIYEAPVMRRITLCLGDLPPALRKVADYILRHPLKAGMLTIEELASATATSPAAVNRFAKALDLGGYIGLKAALMSTLQEVVSPVEKLRSQLEQRPAGEFGLQEHLGTATANLMATNDLNSEQTFQQVVTRMAEARRIYILAFGNTAYLAGLTASNLMPFCADAVAVCMEGGNENAACRLVPIAKDDVLLAISLPRYSLDTVHMARFAKERGAAVLAITDSPASPLCEIADHVLYAPAEHPVLPSSYSAALSLLEGLVAAIMARNKEAVRLSEALTESMLSYLHTTKLGKSSQRDR